MRGGELGGACLALEGRLAQMSVQLVRPVTACPHLGTRRLEQLVERADLIVPGEQLRLLQLKLGALVRKGITRHLEVEGVGARALPLELGSVFRRLAQLR